MDDLKVGRPKMATAGGLLAIVSALLTAVVLLRGLTVLSQEGYEFSAGEIEEVFYTYIWCGVVLAGGILSLRRRYIIGGALAVVFSIAIAISVWFLGVLGVIGGILSLVSKEKTPERVLEIARLYGCVGIGEVAAKTGKTEADVELAVIKLQAKGHSIRFDRTRREVSCG